MAKACDFHDAGQLVPAEYCVRMTLLSKAEPITPMTVDACHKHREEAVVKASAMFHTPGTEMHLTIRHLLKPGAEE
jgi:hypothetical protein